MLVKSVFFLSFYSEDSLDKVGFFLIPVFVSVNVLLELIVRKNLGLWHIVFLCMYI